MNKFLLTFALLGALAPTMAAAQDEPVVVAPTMAPMASVSVFIADLKEPQGLALDNNGGVIVCDYGEGEVLRFSATGAKKDVLASGLKGPTQVTAFAGSLLVSERKANRVIEIQLERFNNRPGLGEVAGIVRNKKVMPIGGEIIEPMGLVMPTFYQFTIKENPFLGSMMGPITVTGQDGTHLYSGVYAVAHTTSKIYRMEKSEWTPVYEASDEDGDTGRYGLRCLAADGDTLFVSDEVNGDVLMMSPGGRMAKFASGFADPSGLEVRGDWLYVCDEGEGGRLWKVSKNGVKTLVAEKLGRPRNVLFLDDKSALVSDRDGRVLKLSWAG